MNLWLVIPVDCKNSCTGFVWGEDAALEAPDQIKNHSELSSCISESTQSLPVPILWPVSPSPPWPCNFYISSQLETFSQMFSNRLAKKVERSLSCKTFRPSRRVGGTSLTSESSHAHKPEKFWHVLLVALANSVIGVSGLSCPPCQESQSRSGMILPQSKRLCVCVAWSSNRWAPVNGWILRPSSGDAAPNCRTPRSPAALSLDGGWRPWRFQWEQED